MTKSSNILSHTSFQAALVGLCAPLVLALSACLLWTGNRVHTTAKGTSLIDQARYIVVARNLAEKGELTSSMIYPSLLGREYKTNVLCMPGYFYVLAVSFRLFGYNAFSAFLPSLLSYIGSCVLVFLIGKRFWDGKVAAGGAFLFATFPPFIIYSFSAMMELVYVFAVLLAFYVFVTLNKSVRPYLGGLVLLIPFLVRETTVLMLPGMALFFLFDDGKKKLLKSLAFIAVSLGCILFLHFSLSLHQRPSFFLHNLLDVDKYTDALVLKDFKLDVLQLIGLVVLKMKANIHAYLDSLLHIGRYFTGAYLGKSCVLFLHLLLFAVLGILLEMRRWKTRTAQQNFFLCFTCISFLITISALVSLRYIVSSQAPRVVLYIAPFVLLSISAIIRGKWGECSRMCKVVMLVVLGGYLVFSGVNIYAVGAHYREMDDHDRRCNNFLEGLEIPDDSLFVAPSWIGRDYFWRHYPVEWSFVPANEETLRLLANKHKNISCLVIPGWHPLIRQEDGSVKKSLLSGIFHQSETFRFEEEEKRSVKWFIYTPTGEPNDIE